MKLNSQFDSELPKYQSIAYFLLDDYKTGGNALARKQSDLAKEFAVNQLTIRHALQWLQKSYPTIFTGPRKKNAILPDELQSFGRPMIGFPIFASSFGGQKLPHLIHNFKVVEAVEDELRRHGYVLDVQWVGELDSENTRQIDQLGDLWSAVIVDCWPHSFSRMPDTFLPEKRDRLIVVDTFETRPNNCVCWDMQHLRVLAEQSFARWECGRIIVMGTADELQPMRDFWKGADQGLSREGEVVFMELPSDAAYGPIQTHLPSFRPGDGVLACNPFLALALIRGLVEANVSRNALQILSLGALPFNDFLPCRVTHLSPDPQALGQAVARMAMAVVESGAQRQVNTYVATNLTVGETTQATP